MRLILASSSIYRRELLRRLGVPFDIIAPELDETPRADEFPEQTAKRLAVAKAHAIGEQIPHALVIGSDQVAVLGKTHLPKPGNHDNAVRQLTMMRGQEVVFYTALCVLNSDSKNTQTRLVPSRVTFRDYSDAQIQRYLAKEQPYHCSASAKAEGLGIALIKKIQCDDPNALVGLPLIALIEMLENEGLEIL